MANTGPSSAVLAQHYADLAQRLVFAIIKAVWCWPMEHYIGPSPYHLYIHIVHIPIHYFIILDGVSHGELVPLHLPCLLSFSEFIRPLRQYE